MMLVDEFRIHADENQRTSDLLLIKFHFPRVQWLYKPTFCCKTHVNSPSVHCGHEQLRIDADVRDHHRYNY